MQIHELTAKQQLDEGLLDLAKKAAGSISNIGNPSAQVARAAQGLQAQGYGAGYQGASAFAAPGLVKVFAVFLIVSTNPPGPTTASFIVFLFSS